MIGQIVEHILEAGFDVYIRQREHMFVLHISKDVGEERCAIDWAISRAELKYARTDFITLECDDRLRQLRAAIAMKRANSHE